MTDNEFNNGLNNNTPENETSQNSEPQDTGYQNVGSSGTNTANTAGDYQSTAAEAEAAAQNAQPSQNQSETAYHTTGQGGAYDYSRNFNQNTQYHAQQEHHAYQDHRYAGSGSGKKWALRIVAGAAALAVCFGTGYGGAVLAMRNGSASRVVTNMVERGGEANITTNDFTAVSAQVAPSVVVITTESMVTSNNWFGGQYVQSGAGSGVVITDDGYILTCNHVVSGASNIKVTLNDDTEYSATLVGGDDTTDVAVLKIDATGLTPATIGDSDSLAVGQNVLAVGNPLGELGGTITSGIISALNREVTVESKTMSLIQMDASVSPGNSGGALFNTNGELIGIVNAKSSGDYAEGLGFAIPINTAYDVAMDLIQSGYVTGRPQLGISVITVDDAATAARYGVTSAGIYIAQVNEGSGAEKAGLQVGDRIVSVDNTLVESSNDVVSMIQEKSVGDKVSIQIARNGQMLTVEVELGEATPAANTAQG